MSPSERRDPFPTTQWSVVARVADGDRAGEALARLFEAYWLPLYCYVRRRGFGPDDARDLIQSYFADAIERRMFARAARERGRFRAFLLHTMNACLASERQRRAALKRGGGAPTLSFDHESAEVILATAADDGLTPEQEFERRWALTVYDRALARLRSGARDADDARRVEELLPYLTDDTPRGSYAGSAARLGTTPEAVKVAVHRLRRRFGRALRREVAETVATADRVDDELRALLEALGPSSP